MKKLALDILAGLRDGIAASLVLAVLYALGFGGYHLLTAATRPERDAIESHRFADQVLRVRFAAAWNEWTLRHPQDSYDHARKETREGEHLTRATLTTP